VNYQVSAFYPRRSWLGQVFVWSLHRSTYSVAGIPTAYERGGLAKVGMDDLFIQRKSELTGLALASPTHTALAATYESC